jgi:hypothetical protein
MYRVISEPDAIEFAHTIYEIISDKAMKWFQYFDSTEAIIRTYKHGPWQFVYCGEQRFQWEVLVWEGKIDPKEHPWESWYVPTE